MEIVELERLSYQLDRATVAAVAEEAPGVPGAEGGQRPSHGLDQRLSGAILGPARRRLELGEGLCSMGLKSGE
jgi:hypothetical protein